MTLTFEPGGLYRTRTGRKVRVKEIWSDDTIYPVYGEILERNSATWTDGNWTTTGRYVSNDVPDGNDLISIWPTSEEQDAARRQIDLVLCRPSTSEDPFGDGRSE